MNRNKQSKIWNIKSNKKKLWHKNKWLVEANSRFM